MHTADKKKLVNDMIFLRGIIEGATYFASDTSMSDALETIAVLFEQICEKVENSLD